MKYIMILLFGITLDVSQAQQSPYPVPPIQTWTTMTNTVKQVVFKLPITPIVKDTAETIVYACPIDTALALQVIIHDNSDFDSSDLVFLQALQQNNGDTLRAVATIALASTNSTLSTINDITTSNGKIGLEFGLEYQSLASEHQLQTIMQIFITNGRFYAFAVTGRTNDILRLNAYKIEFFNTIILN